MRFEQLKRGLKKCAENPWRIFFYLSEHGVLDRLSDEAYLRLLFRATMGQKLRLENPQTFNEKLQWLKLNNRKPEYTVMADKYLVRDYIAKTIGEEYLIPLLGVWERAEDIDFDALPNQFVLKCNHNSGLGMCICKDKSKLDVEKVRAELKQGLAQDYYLTAREWPYQDVPRRIICEKFMTDSGSELADYKIHNFNGEPRMILVCRDRFQASGLTEDFFDENWNHLSVKRPDHPNASVAIPRPAQLEEMLRLSRILSAGHSFLRTDFYTIGDRVYFGELTFFPAAGMGAFAPPEWDLTIGQWLKL